MMKVLEEGIVLQAPSLDKDKGVYVFVGTQENIFLNIVSFDMLAKACTEECEVLFLLYKVKEREQKILTEIGQRNPKIMLSMFEIELYHDNFYFDLSVFKFERDYYAFLPYILKRYEDFLYIKPGTMVQKYEWEDNVFEAQLLTICYEGENGEVLAIRYKGIEYTKKIALAEIYEVVKWKQWETEAEMFEKLNGNMVSRKTVSTIKGGKTEEGFAEEFVCIAKEGYYYEKILYDKERACAKKAKKEMVQKRRAGGKYYLFPFEYVKQGTNVILYAAGNVGTHYREQIQATKYCNLLAVVDKNYEYYQELGENVQGLDILQTENPDYIVIAVANEDTMREIKRELCAMGIAEDKIIASEGRMLEV